MIEPCSHGAVREQCGLWAVERVTRAELGGDHTAGAELQRCVGGVGEKVRAGPLV